MPLDTFHHDVDAIQRLDVVPRILKTASLLTGQGFVAVARVTDDRWVACAALDEIGMGLLPGDELNIKTTICRDVRLNRESVVIDHVAEDAQFNCHPTPALYGFQSYISVPITLPDGELFGTLCAIDPKPAALKDSPALETFTLFADLIGRHLFDIRQVERFREEKRHVQQLLQQSQKMEVVGQLTAGLAHDFNNLLVGISGAFDMVERRLAQSRREDLERFVAMGKESTGRAVSLAARLLAFSRKESAVTEVQDPNDLISGIVDFVKHIVGETVVITCSLADGAWWVRVDANQMELALLNLCVNARDAMPNGGTLRIETENHRVESSEAMELRLAEGDYLVVRVRDNGTGMSAEIVAHVLEPFFTTKPVGTGTGLGLPMVQEFARQAGGALHIASTLETGTTMALYIPRVRSM